MDDRTLTMVLQDGETYTTADDCRVERTTLNAIHNDEYQPNESGNELVALIQSPNPDTLIIYITGAVKVQVVEQ